ncbi:MAG: hypothetical protein ABIG44_12165 [Planctomycetota bacterium]
MNENALKTLKKKKATADELLAAARALAQSRDPQDHAGLRVALGDADFLEALETKEDDGEFEEPLAVELVLEDISNNEAPESHAIIVGLTQNPTFTHDAQRVEALIKACAAVRPAPREVIAFWDKFCQELDGFTPVTIRALLDNASDPALELFERKMVGNEHGEIYKLGWIYNSIVPRRNELAILQSCQRLLTGDLAAELKPALVDGLFDYRPEEWYHPERVVEPADRTQASPPARDELRKIGEHALRKIALTDEQKEDVQSVMEGLSAATP